MEFKEIVTQRYATKQFDGKQIPEEKLRQVLEMTRLAPSAANTQPWKVKVIGDEQTKQALMPATFNQPQVKSCSHLLVFCANVDYAGTKQKMIDTLKKINAPQPALDQVEMILNRIINLAPQQKLAEAQKNTFLAAVTAIYAAKSLGIDSCPMGGFDPAGYAKVLKMPDTLIPTILVPLGYAADTPMPKRRFPETEIFF
ncbi:MAG: nitroreductase [Promethearchaeota archaeon CR_4]|nr:MAG: nitroreductase [Candidatus Lokiarchaeota archaeon CR_4]